MEDIIRKIKKNRIILRVIGLLEIIGGLIGLGVITWFLLKNGLNEFYTFLIFLIAILFYIFSIFAGIKLLQKLECGIIYSVVLQFLQIIAISLGGYMYKLTSAAHFFIGFNFTKGTFDFNFSLLSSEFQLKITDLNSPDHLYINIWAIMIIYILVNLKESITDHEKTINDSKNQLEPVANNV